jgi:hypothetical protein
MSSDCRECRAGVEHCHGTIIDHPGRRLECTELDCDHPDGVAHAFHIDCDVVGCRCGEVIALAV